MNTMDFCFKGNFRCSPDNEQLFSSLVCNSNPLNSEGLSWSKNRKNTLPLHYWEIAFCWLKASCRLLGCSSVVLSRWYYKLCVYKFFLLVKQKSNRTKKKKKRVVRLASLFRPIDTVPFWLWTISLCLNLSGSRIFSRITDLTPEWTSFH